MNGATKNIDEQIAEAERVLANLKARLSEISIAKHTTLRSHFEQREDELNKAISEVKARIEELKAQKARQ